MPAAALGAGAGIAQQLKGIDAFFTAVPGDRNGGLFSVGGYAGRYGLVHFYFLVILLKCWKKLLRAKRRQV